MHKKWGVLFFCFVIAAMVFISSAVCAQSRTITGTVYNSYELVTDKGDVYVITADDIGDELVVMDGALVRVTGDVEDLGGEYAITVTGFKVLTDDLPEQDQELQEESQEEELPEDEKKE
jgi:hypothetical protein